MNILIINAYSWYEKGDSGIILSMVKSLSKFFPKANFTVITATPDVDASQYKRYGIETIGNVLNTIRSFELTGARFYNDSQIFFHTTNTRKSLRKIRIVKGVKTAFKLLFFAWVYKLFKTKVPRLLNTEEYIFFTKYVDADIVMSCGGGFLNDYSVSSLLNNLIQIYLSLMLSKPTIIYAQSIGPFRRKIWFFVTRFVLNKTSLILVREKISQKLLKKMSVSKPKVIVTADAAFILPSINKIEAERILLKEKVSLNDRPLIGITVRKWFFPGLANQSDKYRTYLQVISKVVDYLTEQLKAKVVFIPQVIVHSKDDDRIAACEVYQMVKNKEKVKIMMGDYSPEEIKAIIGLMDLFIGTRMHSNIFALSMHVPTIAISYEHKTEGIMRMLGLTKFVVPIDALKYEDLVSKINEVWEQREKLRKKLISKVKIVQKRAILNAKLVKDFLESN